MLEKHIPLNDQKKEFIGWDFNHQFQAAGFAGPPLTSYTHPKTNMEPKNGSLKQEIPIGKHHVHDLCEIFGE